MLLVVDGVCVGEWLAAVGAWMAGNGIGAEGAQALCAGLVHVKELRHLDVYSTCVFGLWVFG